MEPARASLAAVGGSGSFGTGPPWSGYLSAANSLISGARVLAAGGRECGEAHTLVAGFVAEALLKVLLVRSGIDEKDLRSPRLRHDLKLLWEQAAARGQPLVGVAPEWIQRLNDFHKSPYVARYMNGVNAYSLPLAAEIQAGMEELLELILASLA